MSETAPASDDGRLTQIEEALSAADCDVPVAIDAPRPAYRALPERLADSNRLFVAQRRRCAEVAPTYMALTKRPGDFEGLFAPQSRRRAEQTLSTFEAPTEAPSGSTIGLPLAAPTPSTPAQEVIPRPVRP